MNDEKSKYLDTVIVSEYSFTPSEYLELMLDDDDNYINQYLDNENSEEYIARILAERMSGDEFNQISEYPLSEAYQLYDDINKGKHFVLLRLFANSNDNSKGFYYRFYEITEKAFNKLYD